MAEGFFGSPVRVRPENRLRWDLSPEQIQKMSDDIVSENKAVDDAVASLDLDKVTFSNTLKALAHAHAEFLLVGCMLHFNSQMSPSKEVRTASTQALIKLWLSFLDVNREQDKHLRIMAMSTKVDIDSLTSEDKRYMETHIDNESLLPKDKQDEMTNIAKQLLQRCEEQKPHTFQELVEIKAEIQAWLSALQGFKTRADYVLSRNMANSAENVSIFLDELAYKLKPLGDKERAILLRLKKDHCQKKRLPFNGKLDKRDLEMYMAQVNGKYGVNHYRLREYFPLEVVTQGLLDIYQDLLGLSFSLVDGAPVWHPSVSLFSVTDQSSQQMVGQFYLDLFYRKGKNMKVGGTCFLLQPGCLLPDGSRQIPIAVIVTEFGSSKSTPCLLYHQQVLTYFHEFGHIMHHLCAQVDYAVFNSFMVEEDFVEAPSQVFENWFWEKETLQRVSKHYKTGAPIPNHLLNKVIKSRHANIGMKYLQEIIEAKLDQAIHTQVGLDRGKEYARLTEKILGVHAPKSTKISDRFVFEPIYQNPAKRYCYLWGEVLAMDMFYSRFKQEGIMNPKVGLDYRECILKPGASKDAEEMLKNFLGREPNQEAFLLSKGLTTLETRKRKLKESQMKKRKRTGDR